MRGNQRRIGLNSASIVLAAACCGAATAQPLNFRIEVSDHSMQPLHSHASGEIGDNFLFFAGISGMGLHSLIQGAEPGEFPPSFPVSVFSTQVQMFNHVTGDVYTSDIDHLPQDLQLALTMTNPASVQYDDTLYIYGGYGPTADGTDWDTRDTVTAVDLVQVRDALLAGQPVPASAFGIESSPDVRVAGGVIVKLDQGAERTFVLIGGSTFIGDYAGNTPFLNLYAQKAHIFDADSSMTVPVKTLEGSSLHRRDMNALPMTYNTSENGPVSGFAIAGGVFQNGFFVWETPLSYRLGEEDVTDEFGFSQKMNQYEGIALSFYSPSENENRQVLFGGISASRYENGQFIGDFEVPWVNEITQINVKDGVYQEEIVIGETPLPTTNTHVVVAENIPTLPNGQVLIEELPANEVLIAYAPGGLRAAEPAGAPMTYASGQVWEIYATFGVRGDINRDGIVDGADLAALLSNWGSETATVPDLNNDGVINGADLAILLALWGNNTPG